MELFRLRYFMAVAEHGSFSEAARRAHVSQPSLSAQIRALEAHLGCRLLIRSRRGARVTPAGERLLESCRRIFQELQDAEDALERREFRDLPVLRLGVQPMLAGSLLAPALGRVLAHEPKARVSVRERPNSLLVDLVERDEAELCLMSLPESLPLGFEVLRLLRVRYAAVVRPRHALASKRRLLLRDLVSYRVLLFLDPTGIEHEIARLAAAAEIETRVVFQSEQASSVLEMAASDLGVGVVPLLLSTRARAMGLAAIPLYDRGLDCRIGVVWRRARTLSALASRLVDELRKDAA